jgi:hypothetical protein
MAASKIGRGVNAMTYIYPNYPLPTAATATFVVKRVTHGCDPGSRGLDRVGNFRCGVV